MTTRICSVTACDSAGASRDDCAPRKQEAMDVGFAKNILTGLKRRSLADTLSFTFGRFHGVRRVYGLGVGILQRRQKLSGRAPDGASVFASFPIAPAVEAIERTAVFGHLRLPPQVVDELLAYAKTTPLRPPTKTYTFGYHEVSDGKTPNGDPAILAVVVGADRHPLVRQIAEDPQVRAVVRRYLGYDPKSLNIRLIWSFVCDAPDEVRGAAAQTIAYHFDVHDYNFIYANYYLTDCDARSGAHAMILTSHRSKPLSWLLGSVRQDRAAITRYYGEKNELVIEGPAGTGFVQDASCYHKAMAPIDRERLMLQIRYS